MGILDQITWELFNFFLRQNKNVLNDRKHERGFSVLFVFLQFLNYFKYNRGCNLRLNDDHSIDQWQNAVGNFLVEVRNFARIWKHP